MYHMHELFKYLLVLDRTADVVQIGYAVALYVDHNIIGSVQVPLEHDESMIYNIFFAEEILSCMHIRLSYLLLAPCGITQALPIVPRAILAEKRSEVYKLTLQPICSVEITAHLSYLYFVPYCLPNLHLSTSTSR